MREMEKAKERYDAIPVPEELYVRVQKEIEKSSVGKKIRDKERTGYPGKRAGILAAAAAMILFVTALNTNTAFAREISEIPVLGAVARIFTFRSYVEESDDLKVSVEIPSLEMIAEETNGLADSVNQEIHTLCEQYADEAVKRAEEYKKAFLETGGTQEEWEAHNIEIKVFYEMKSQTEDFLSFAVSGTENWTSAYSETRYYNIDLKSEKLVTLEDMLGEDYITIVNTDIQRQIQSREESGEVFFSPEEGGFTGISDDVKFYMNEAGNPVIVFEKYEIAPGSAGEVEFEIEGNDDGEQAVTEKPSQEEEQKKQETSESTAGYEDNFAVDSEAAVGELH
ncbi:MAG: DUF3298 domain-containing protein [Lachnospiraceae bacterium]|nr:DUF3298 domain-containing protein [Lachnospiraceae bacterium]